MKQTKDVFERCEKKYILDETQYLMLLEGLEAHMTPDEYGLYTICNLYYDTSQYELIRRSLERPLYKEKLRLRSYGVPHNMDTVFLELKKKFSGIVYKRRMALPLHEALAYLQHGEKPRQTGQIFYEIDWFQKRYAASEKVFIAYDRTAYFGNGDQELRVTFDQNIRYRTSVLDLTKGDWGNPVIDSGLILMELKLPGVMPLWLCHLLTRLEIFPVSFSKYGACFQQFIWKEWKNEGGFICA